jgi:hypothetical protein
MTSCIYKLCLSSVWFVWLSASPWFVDYLCTLTFWFWWLRPVSALGCSSLCRLVIRGLRVFHPAFGCCPGWLLNSKRFPLGATGISLRALRCDCGLLSLWIVFYFNTFEFRLGQSCSMFLCSGMFLLPVRVTEFLLGARSLLFFFRACKCSFPAEYLFDLPSNGWDEGSQPSWCVLACGQQALFLWGWLPLWFGFESPHVQASPTRHEVMSFQQIEVLTGPKDLRKIRNAC